MYEATRERNLSGAALKKPLSCRAPGRETLSGQRVSLREIRPEDDAPALFGLAHGNAQVEAIWDYMPYGPFADAAEIRAWLEGCARREDPLFYVIEDHQRGASGMCSYLEIEPAHGATEIGHIWFAPRLQRTAEATEAIYLMMHHAFEALGNRRLQWKCNALNESSRSAALRFGFSYERIAYQHKVVKGCNRDTAYYSLMDHEWPSVRENFQRWLDDSNFDSQGRQRSSLRALINC